MNLIHYLKNIFKCKSSDNTFDERIFAWLEAVDNPAPEGITAIYIGIFESEDSTYMLHLAGSRHYDENDEDWACDEDFVPEQQYTELYTKDIKDTEWESILNAVVSAVSRYLKTKADSSSSLFHGKIVAVGFDDGNLVRVQ